MFKKCVLSMVMVLVVFVSFSQAASNIMSKEKEEFLAEAYRVYADKVKKLGFTQSQLDSIIYLTDINVTTNEIIPTQYTSLKNVLGILCMVSQITVKPIKYYGMVAFSMQRDQNPPLGMYFVEDGGTLHIKRISSQGENQEVRTTKDKIGFSILFKNMINENVRDMANYYANEQKSKQR